MIDTRETWKHFFTRILNFEHAPLVERSELPPEKQPHRSLYGKVSCYINGISPYPPKATDPVELLVNEKEEKNSSTDYQADINKDNEESKDKEELKKSGSLENDENFKSCIKSERLHFFEEDEKPTRKSLNPKNYKMDYKPAKIEEDIQKSKK